MFNLDFAGQHVVVTGGTAALGAAVVRLLIDAGAICHIPAFGSSDGPSHDRVRIQPGIDLTNESAVAKFFDSLPSLWASVHTAGGFVAANIADTSLATWKQMQETNGVTCSLCCREVVRKIRASGSGGG